MSPREDPADRLDALARAAARGDEDAFEALVRRVHRRIFRWALARLADVDEAEDATQRVLLRLHRHLPEWRGDGRFTSWLYRVTVNAASNEERRRAAPDASRHRPEGARSRVETRPGEDGPGESDRPGESDGAVVRRLYAREVVGLVEAFFRDLPPRQREVFDLVDLQGLSPAEVAEMLEMNGSTVRANLFKARRAIRLRVLERHPELEEGYGG